MLAHPDSECGFSIFEKSEWLKEWDYMQRTEAENSKIEKGVCAQGGERREEGCPSDRSAQELKD